MQGHKQRQRQTMLPEASVPIPQLSSRTLSVLVPKGFCLLLSAQLSLPPFHPKFTTSLQDLNHRGYCQNRHSGSWGRMDPLWVWCQWCPQPTCCPPTSPPPGLPQPKHSLSLCNIAAGLTQHLKFEEKIQILCNEVSLRCPQTPWLI